MGSHSESLSQVLSPAECSQASRYRFEVDRLRFVMARGLLRMLLARYTARLPAAIEFSYNDFGKPRMHPPGEPELHFNVSHSGNLALFAVARVPVGVDVEQIRPDFATEEIAERFFAAEEVAALRGLPKDLQPRAFFHCWTRKEAYIKACGQGLSMPLRDFAVSLRPGQPAALLRHAEASQLSEWTLRDLPAPDSYVAALAIRLKEPVLQDRAAPMPEQLLPEL